MNEAGIGDGDAMELSVVGYQFPDAVNPQMRYSWYMVQGRARTARESWDFRWQALTCDESPRLGAWLRAVADMADHGQPAATGQPHRMEFTEPNLAFEVVDHGPRVVRMRVELDFESGSRATRWTTAPATRTCCSWTCHRNRSARPPTRGRRCRPLPGRPQVGPGQR